MTRSTATPIDNKTGSEAGITTGESSASTGNYFTNQRYIGSSWLKYLKKVKLYILYNYKIIVKLPIVKIFNNVKDIQTLGTATNNSTVENEISTPKTINSTSSNDVDQGIIVFLF